MLELTTIKGGPGSGDKPGHPFRGNQWSGGGGIGQITESLQRKLSDLATNDFRKTLVKEALSELSDALKSAKIEAGDIKEMILFGSFLTDKEFPNDIDMIVVTDRGKLKPKEDWFVTSEGTVDAGSWNLSHKLNILFVDTQETRDQMIRQYAETPVYRTGISKYGRETRGPEFGIEKPASGHMTVYERGEQKSPSRLAVAKHLLSVATQAVQLKRMLLKDQLRQAVVKAVHVRQWEEAEREIKEAASDLIKRQFASASRTVKQDGSTGFEPRDWDQELVDALLPVLMKKAGEAAAAQMLLMGVDVAPKRKLRKGGPGSGDKPGHPFRGNQWNGGRSSRLTQDSFKTDDADTTERVHRLAAKRVAENWDCSDDDIRSLLKEEGWNKLTEYSGSELKEKAALAYIELWGSSSGFPVSVMAMASVAKDQGRDFTLYDDQKSVVEWFEKNPGQERAAGSLGRAIYATTQDWLRERGIENIDLFRSGAKGDPSASGRVMSSWSISESGTRSGNLELIRSSIPVKDVFSVPGTGFGTLMESEVVVLPNKGRKYEVIGNKSPSFTSTKTTATDWLLENEDVAGDLLWPEVFTLPSGAVVDMGFATEWPDWMKTEISKQMKETFEQPFWAGINDTTASGIQSHVLKGLEEGLSIREIQQMMVGDGLDEYYRNRGQNIARTEAGNALNGARSAAMDRLSEEVPGLKTKKTWMSVLGTTTRDSHAALDGVPADRNGEWYLGGVKIPWPAHWRLPPSERCSCQCTLVQSWGMPDSEAEQLIEDYNRRLAEERAARDFWTKHLAGRHDQSSHGRGGSVLQNHVSEMISHLETIFKGPGRAAAVNEVLSAAKFPEYLRGILQEVPGADEIRAVVEWSVRRGRMWEAA